MSNFIWIIFILLLILFSFKLTFKDKFITYRLKDLLSSIDRSNLTSACMFLGTKMGVGTIISTTIILYECGPSSIIWMIIFTIITMPITYHEAYLGYKYRKKIDGSYISGPSYYMKNKYIKNIYLYLFLFAYTCLFLMLQTNTIINIIDINIFVNKYVLFFIFFVLLTYLLINDLTYITSVLNKLVIVMIIFMLLLFTIVIIRNAYLFNEIINLIVEDFFALESIMYGLIPSIVLSIKRVIFQSELLVGTTSISASLSNSSIESSTKITVLSSYFILIISLMISYLILVYRINIPMIEENYFYLISNVFTYHYGFFGKLILIFLFIILSLTTIIGAYYFGINNIKNYGSRYLILAKLLMLFFPLCGIFINSNLVWVIVDTSLIVLMLLNFIEIRCLYDRQ